MTAHGGCGETHLRPVDSNGRLSCAFPVPVRDPLGVVFAHKAIVMGEPAGHRNP
jgi:hypothetical protein